MWRIFRPPRFRLQMRLPVGFFSLPKRHLRAALPCFALRLHRRLPDGFFSFPYLQRAKVHHSTPRSVDGSLKGMRTVGEGSIP